jgi:uncharacterized protein (DUF2141 family)
MRTIFGFFIMLSTMIIPLFGDDSADMILILGNVKNTNGVIGVAIFSNPSGFPGDHMKAYKKVKVKAVKGTNVITIHNLPYGEYCVAIMHDENKNDSLDMGIFGPLEGYGFSKNIPGSLFGPGFDECKIKINQPEIKLNIIIRY